MVGGGPAPKRIHKETEEVWITPPEAGGRHFYMRYGSYTLTVPSNKEYSTPQLRMLLNEIEQGSEEKSASKNGFFIDNLSSKEPCFLFM